MTEEANQPTAIISVFAQPVEQPTAAWCVEMLEKCGGSLSKWRDNYPQNQIADDEQLFTRTEQWLASLEDKSLYRRWQTAIKQNAIVRLRLLQNKALARLEALAAEEKPNFYAMAKEATAHKMLLGDLLAGQTHLAKQKIMIVEEDKEDDDPDLDEVLNGA